MVTRGTAMTYLIENAQTNIDEEWRETYFNSKSEVLARIFALAYSKLSEQPYSLYFF